MEKLSEQQITETLKTLPGWQYSEGSIKKVFKTQNFPATMGSRVRRTAAGRSIYDLAGL